MYFIKPKFWDKKNNSFLSILLYPLSIIYYLISIIKKKVSVPQKFKIPIICVGNIYIGGTGKTSVAIEIIKILSKSKKVCFLTKGYGRKNKKDIYLNQLNMSNLNIEDTGDEALLLNKFGHVYISNNRAIAINTIIKLGYEAIILDDGFQDNTILKNLNILCFDSKSWIGNGNLIPSGPLREPLKSIKKANYVIFKGSKRQDIEKKIKTINPDISGDFSEIMRWADEVRTLKIRANAETPLDSRTARGFGAEGIGLCRTEHMFFDEERILYVRQMILSKTREDRLKALEKILPFQRKDFVEIFTIMKGLPVTVRLLDPPLHEFLPKTEKEIDIVAKSLKIHSSEIKNRINYLHEENPMLGHRGCRLAISFPEIYEMQCRAIFEALYELQKQKVEAVIPEIMIPLVATEREIEILKLLVDRVAKEVQKNNNFKVDYLVGTMIELPRAALNAKNIAKHTDFFSFGTNDLTQTTLGISRDDSGKFLDDYVENKIFKIDPFISIDQDGVGELIKLACSRGLETNKNIKLGICGEHGGDPDSIDFCHRAGLNYVSCSPYRVPIARLSAAQASIRSKNR